MFVYTDKDSGERDGVENRFDRLWVNGRLATMRTGAPGYGAIERGAIAARDGRIVWIGPMAELSAGIAADETLDLDGHWVTPGLIDCHTHLVYAGDRAAEFELRLNGATYEEIARAGGGIASTTRATREADEAALVASTLPRLDALLAEGLTTIEIKSGYGLTPESETRMLAAVRRLATLRDVTIRTTFLGAHAVPPEYAGDADGYIDLVCKEMIPKVAAAGLADAVDGFCETIGFDRQQIRRVFETARAHRLPVKLHAEQLSNMGGAALAAEFGALSADHLEHLDAAGAEALARAGTVAVLLPGAFYFLRETRVPPVEMLRERGVPMAVATDSNPGSSPLTSLLLAMNMAATLFRLTAEEALAGTTREAARALGLAAECGTLEVGKWCDLAVWDIERPAELVYRMGFNPLHSRVRRGQ
jgi:imidazolonepropionase